ncbi:MAG: hypothetical protein MJ176_03135 [Treponema sp.]|nr:hypothetical protein [Treponema sp.]
MTDKEKAEAEEYAKKKIKVFDKDSSYYFFHVKQAYLDGLAEGKKELEQWKQEWQDAQIKANEEGIARTTIQIKYKEFEKENAELLESCRDKDRQLNNWFLSYNEVIKENEELNRDKTELVNSVTELTNSKTELENKVTELKSDKEYLDKVNNEQTEVILKLNEQIEKMKCCENCKKHRNRECSEDKKFFARTQNQCDEWECK